MVEIKAKLWLESDSEFLVGAGRADLLRRIRENGSIAVAARSMSMSYSHAWSEVRSISIAAGGPVVETTRGGKEGGCSSLTELGENILKQFELEEASLERHLARRNKR